jgi:hypothetical protein
LIDGGHAIGKSVELALAREGRFGHKRQSRQPPYSISDIAENLAGEPGQPKRWHRQDKQVS